MKERIVDVEIEVYSKKGHGVAPYNNSKVEVVGSAIGDLLEVSLRGRKKRVHNGHILSIKKPSSLRVIPSCSHSGSCGGCCWQHLDYNEQLKIKEDQIKELYQESEKTFTFLPIQPSISNFAYRNKMEFSFSQDLKGNKYLGLIIAKSRGKVENIEICHLVNPWMSEVLASVRNWFENEDIQAFHAPSAKGTLRTLTLREGMKTGEKMVMLTISSTPEYALSKQQLHSFQKQIVRIAPEASIFLRIHQAIKGEVTKFYEMLLSGSETFQEHLEITAYGQTRKYIFDISPTSFFQPNTLVAEKLFESALEICELNKDMSVFDLYSGTSTLGIVFSPFVKNVVSIELNPYATFDAKVNIENNHIVNMEVIQGDVGEILQDPSFQNKHPQADLVIVDPPRTGLDVSAIQNLLNLDAKQLLYISCNPRTQKEDLVKLCQVYKLVVMKPFDQFPHTPHVENIAYLVKK